MTNKILKNAKEDFILKYRAAIKAKISKEQLAEYLGMKPNSLDRRRQELRQELGLDLPPLYSLNEPFKRVEEYYFDILNTMATKILKVENINSSQTTISIKTNKRYVITSAQNATPIHQSFLTSIKKYCEYNEAELLVIPYRYKNPTSIWSMNDKSDDWWDNAVVPFLISEELKLGQHIKVMGQIKIQPTAVSPLSGFDGVSGLDSAIFGHPKLELKSIPSVGDKFPKILTTTGSITKQNYTDSKAGHKGALHHTFGAIVLEIDDDEVFHIRHIIADKDDGSFYDLDKKYTSKSVLENQRALALIAGDIHAEFVDEDAANALFRDDDSLANIINPECIVLHDLLDSSQRSHHNIRDALGRFRKHITSFNDNVEEGLQKAANFIESISRKDTINYVVSSNHIEHLDRWLREADPTIDPENAKFFYYMKYNQYKAIKEGRDFDSLEFWFNNPDEYQGLSEFSAKKTYVLKRSDTLEIGGLELSLHGDVGPNGSRGSLNNLSRMGQKVIIGHSHTPGIQNGSYQVGTTSKLKLDYVKGPSSWIHTSAICYPSGEVTLINVINGKWKL